MNNRRMPVALVLLVGGILLAYYCHREVEAANSGFRGFAKQFSSDEQSRSSRLETGRIAGVAIAVGGAVILGGSLMKKG